MAGEPHKSKPPRGVRWATAMPADLIGLENFVSYRGIYEFRFYI